MGTMKSAIRRYFMQLLIPLIMALIAAILCIMQKEKLLGRDSLPPAVERFNNVCSSIWIFSMLCGSLINYHFQEWRQSISSRRKIHLK